MPAHDSELHAVGQSLRYRFGNWIFLEGRPRIRGGRIRVLGIEGIRVKNFVR
jgi:hypothetical protein